MGGFATAGGCFRRVAAAVAAFFLVAGAPAIGAEAAEECPALPAQSSLPPRARNSPFGPQANHSMLYRPLGRSGLRVSVVSYGSWLTVSETGVTSSVEKATAILREVVRSGINFIDNAESYGAFIGESEYIMGRALRTLFDEGNVERADLVISTKLWRGGDGVNDVSLSRKHLVEGMRASLQRMQLDYVDMVFCHRPDPTTPLEETVRAMNHILERGWAFYWGTSEWSASQIERADGIARQLGLVGPVVEQPLYNLFNRQRVEQEYLPLYSSIGLGLTIYSPLAEGILGGRYLAEGAPPADSRAATIARKKDLAERSDQIQATRELLPLALEAGCTLAQLALAWTIRHPRVSTAIMGASRPEQVAENAGAVGCLQRAGEAVLARAEAIAGAALKPDATAAQIEPFVQLRGPHA